MKRDHIRYYALPTATEGRNRIFDLEKAEKLFEKCNLEGNAAAGGSQAAGDSVSEPVLKKIVILNSTETSGVAAKWKDAFQKRGYEVLEIGNYSPQLDKTRIVVKKDGQGEEFLDYFSEAELHIGKVPDGADAQIIIGTGDTQP